jgi:protein TonB
MKHSANALFYPAIGISAMAHLLLLLFLPYRPAQPSRSPVRELIPIRLFHTPPAARTPAIQQSAARVPATAAPLENKPPVIQQVPRIEEAPPVEEGPLPEQAAPLALVEALSPASEAGAITEQADGEGKAAPAAVQETAATRLVEVAEPSAEIAGYQAILSTLRGRIVESIRYPAIARASGWKGTVVLSVRLDAAGRLQETIVRRSSGYEVLDRAAAALLRKVTPVSNPLARPLSIEIPIAYELK